MSAVVTLEHAKKIIKKLKASLSGTQSTHHVHYSFVHNKKVVLSFAVSHTPQKGKPQSHLPSQLHLNAFQTREFANCNITYAEYVKILRKLHIL